MDVKQNYSLKKYNSFNIDVVAKEFIQINSVKELIDLQKNSKNKNKLFIGGGSNILFTNNFEGLVVHINLKGISVKKMNENFSEIKVMSGENWNELVNWCIENNLGGLENLSLIPGNVGAAPIQNIGAYFAAARRGGRACGVDRAWAARGGRVAHDEPAAAGRARKCEDTGNRAPALR